MSDKAAEIARFILNAPPKARHLVFDLLKIFHGVPAEQLERGILIAVELEEAEILAAAQACRASDLPTYLRKDGAE
ncbi:hypothetical protein [Rhizobium herbae]|uniref:Uncharacterized protein n=1 Tax=Rhizobium herbae TaxID=508661 RepID=A0ABS4EFW7_9HYPH|nr:hypothetical protein [Rhizobium herbae]MBP1856844.1 hypothetical protein [Rhizobium herbae]